MSQHVSNYSSQSSSGVSPNSPSGTPSTTLPTAPLVPSPADFSILATMLQDIAQVLLKYDMHKPNSNAEAVANAEKSSQQEPLEQMEQLEQGEQLSEPDKSDEPENLEQPKQSEKSEQSETEEPSEKEQSVTFSYNTEEKRTPAFLKMYGDIIGQYKRGEFHDEIRCFHLSESNVREEHALLKKHDCVHLAEFLYRTHDELSMFVNLLCSVDNDIILPAKVLQQAFYKMELLLENLEELHTHMENYEQVHKVIIPA